MSTTSPSHFADLSGALLSSDAWPSGPPATVGVGRAGFDPHGPRRDRASILELCLGSASPDRTEAQHSQTSLLELLGWQHVDKKFAVRANDERHVQRESGSVFNDDPHSNKDRVTIRPTGDDILCREPRTTRQQR